MKKIMILAVMLHSATVFATQFNVAEMPEGAEVTVPQAATTVVPVRSKVTIGSTDQPQTIRIVAPSQGPARNSTVSLTIEDSSRTVKTVKVSPGTPFLYSFKGLSSVTISSELQDANRVPSKSLGGLSIESDKPLTVKVVRF
jgi:hypothetical protein